MNPNLIPLKDAVKMWNEQRNYSSTLLMSYCHKNKEKSFVVYETKIDKSCKDGDCEYIGIRKCLDVGYIKINNKCYVDKDKLQKAITESLIIENEELP